MARLQAEEIVLTERVWLEPEPGADPDRDEAEAEDEQSAPFPVEPRWVPMVEDPTDPWWIAERQQEEDLRQD